MSTFIETSVFFGVVVSLLAYGIGMLLKQRFHLGVFNPLLISIVITIGVLLLCHIDYNTYNEGAKYLSYLLTPATVALAIPLYDQLAVLKKNWKAILAGIASGVLTSLLCVLALVLLFGLSHEEYVTLLPKSITTAIGIGISEELGGYVSITAAVIIITGVLGFNETGTALMLTIFALQDSFGTACNVTGDGALTLILTGYAKKHNIKEQHIDTVDL